MSIDSSTGRDPSVDVPKIRETSFIERTETDGIMGIKWEEQETGKFKGTQNITVHIDGKELKYTVTLSNISDKKKGAKLLDQKIVNIVQIGIDQGIIPGSQKTLKYSTVDNTYTKLSADKTSSKKVEEFDKILANRQEKLEMLKNELAELDQDDTLESIGTIFDEMVKEEKSPVQVRLEQIKNSIAKIQDKLETAKKLENLVLHRSERSEGLEIPSTSDEPISTPIKKMKSTSLINEFVSEFLNPYLTGKITPETEDRNRKPMITSLFETFKIDDSQKELVTNLAFDAYIQKSATLLARFKNFPNEVTFFIQSVFQKNDLHSQRRQLREIYEHQISLLVNSLTFSLAKDFPGKTFDQKELEDKVFEAFFSIIQADMAYQRDMAPTSSDGEKLEKLARINKEWGEPRL